VLKYYTIAGDLDEFTEEVRKGFLHSVQEAKTIYLQRMKKVARFLPPISSDLLSEFNAANLRVTAVAEGSGGLVAPIKAVSRAQTRLEPAAVALPPSNSPASVSHAENLDAEEAMALEPTPTPPAPAPASSLPDGSEVTSKTETEAPPVPPPPQEEPAPAAQDANSDPMILG